MSAQHRTPRRLARVVSATALALPLGLTATIAPVEAATARVAPLVRTVDAGGYGYPGYGGFGGYGGYPVYGGYGYPSYGGTTAETETAGDTSDATDAESVGLVEITSTLDYGSATSAGTGMVLRRRGIVVTNHHVVAGATRIRVTVVSTGRTYTARVIGADARRDVAVLKLVGATDLTPVDTSTAAVTGGEAVTAVGDANGDGGSLTAAPGTVVQRRTSISVSDDDGTKTRLRHLIEVSSDIIPGDSGGALLDDAGDVVGMNVAASEGTGDTTGYVIPLARVLRVADQVLAGDDAGTVTLGYPAFLGVELSSAGSSLEVGGVLARGHADEAGLAAGDTITALDGTLVRTGQVTLTRGPVA